MCVDTGPVRVRQVCVSSLWVCVCIGVELCRCICRKTNRKIPNFLIYVIISIYICIYFYIYVNARLARPDTLTHLDTLILCPANSPVPRGGKLLIWTWGMTPNFHFYANSSPPSRPSVYLSLPLCLPLSLARSHSTGRMERGSGKERQATERKQADGRRKTGLERA